ncbi:MAG: RsmB/NOP family class I SAM-dependent RNA methyltransferase [Lachnospiraceae bacterium]|nr:RsmB/NOP family class I SAM-dependent RNA methyltransferase [Lachnospiraceae bacterium]
MTKKAKTNNSTQSLKQDKSGAQNTNDALKPVLPPAFIERMRGMLGAEFSAFLDSYENESAYGLRYNPLKTERERFEQSAGVFLLHQIPWAKEGYACKRELHPGKHVLHEAGAYYIQDPSAMSAAEALGVQPGERILDLCAAPGGKTTQLAGKLNGSGLLVSNEIVPSRARILSQNVERFGIRNCVVLNEEPSRIAEHFPCFFHRILVDAPCSGEGMFRKDENARAEWSAERVMQCAERQLAILESADRMLKPGGMLLYATCTFAPMENEGVIIRFLRRHPEYELTELPFYEGMEHGHPEWAATYGGVSDFDADKENEVLHIERCLRLFPHRLTGEGHFLAGLMKRGEPHTDDQVDESYPRVPQTKKKEILALWEQFAEETLTFVPDGIPVTFGEQLYLVPSKMRDFKNLKVERAGLHLGEYKKNRFEPAHALARALSAPDVTRSRELSLEEAERYFRGETIMTKEELRGWVLLTFEGYALGWGKASGAQIKNHYPKGLRTPG